MHPVWAQRRAQTGV